MVNPEHFQLSREELEGRLKWYNKKYGPYIGNRGVQNWKNLFRKPSLTDWTILFMLIMALFIAWAYQHDIAMCREYINNQMYQCPIYNQTYNPTLNYDNFTIKEDKFVESGGG